MKANAWMQRNGGANGRRLGAVGLLLALLAANPLQGFGQGVIDADQTTGVNLDVAFPAGTTTVTVNPGITVTDTNSFGYAISGNSLAWGLTNNGGTLSATGTGGVGVNFGLGGSVDNLADGTILADNIGVSISGGQGFVVNAGTITGTNGYGVYLNAGGGVNNQNGGMILGNSYGVYITGTNGFVDNAGTITGANDTGVYMTAGGSVNNQTGGMILGGNYGVYLYGGAGSVTNAGTITGTYYAGVELDGGGSVNNQTGGMILGGSSGVYIYGGAGSVDNAGTITGTNGTGVYLTAGGSVNNQNGGMILGNDYGVYIYGAAGSVTNAGTITGTGSAGVELDAGGSVNNQTGAMILGYYDGVDIYGAAGFVDNAGTITGTYGTGVYLNAGGSVNNQTGGIILGNNQGVYITGTNGFVDNAGTITGANDTGVYLDAGGSVNNQNGGMILGNYYGVYIAGGPGTVTNAGTITGTYDTGVYLDAGGSVNNQTGAMILGGSSGVYIYGGAGSVANAGTITGTNGTGVYLTAGGIVDNQPGGIIRGDTGIKFGGFIVAPVFVTNAGTIIGTGGTAIQLGGGDDSVTLLDGSVVQGNIQGSAGTDVTFLLGTQTNSYGGDFLNFERLTVQGLNWNLTGNNTFSLDTTVNGGVLRVNGTLTSAAVTINAGTTLAGTGKIFGAVNNFGTISPGNSLGTLNIAGALTFQTGSFFDLEVGSATPGNSDKIVVTGAPGTATLNGGEVRATVPRVLYAPDTTYPILITDGGVTGTFALLTPSTNSVFLDPRLQYKPTNVSLLLGRTFASVASTPNQGATAQGLDSAVQTPGALSNLLTEMFWLGSASEARRALDSLSGEIHGTIGMLDAVQLRLFTDVARGRLGRIRAGKEGAEFASAQPVQLASTSPSLPGSGAAPDKPWGGWARGFGLFGQLDDDGNAAGGDFTIGGGSGGLEYLICPNMLAGFAVGYSQNDVSVEARQSSGNVDGVQLAGYASYVSGPWYLDGILGYGFLQTETQRRISVGPIQQTAEAEYDGHVLTASAEGGYTFKCGLLEIQPSAGLSYAGLWQDDFVETGAGPNGLSGQNLEYDSLRSLVGLRLAAQFGKPKGPKFVPEVRARWEHEFLDQNASFDARFIGGGGSFVTRGVQLGRESVVVGAGLAVVFSQDVSAYVDYDAHFNDQLTAHAVSGGVSVRW